MNLDLATPDSARLDALAARAGDVGEPAPSALVAGRHHLDRAIDAADARVTAVRRSRRPRRWGITALAGAAAATAVLAVPLLSAGPASAEEVFLAAAEAAGQQADVAAGAAYWHVVSEVAYPDVDPFRREIWQGRTAPSVLRDEEAATRAAAGGALDPALVLAESLGGPASFTVAGEQLTWQDLEDLPTDPAELEALLRSKVDGHPAGEEGELWESVTGLLMESPASPELRRALWQFAASMPDVEVLGAMTDAAGREGIGVERDQLDDEWYRAVYVLDPTTGALLEARDVAADGTVVFRLTQLEEGPVATAPALDPPRCGPGSVPEISC